MPTCMQSNKYCCFFSVAAGDIFVGVISHLLDSETLFVVKEDSLDLLKDNAEIEGTEIWWYPTIYEKFLVQIDGLLYRAARIPCKDDSISLMQLFLLDTGETLKMPLMQIPSGSFFEMRESEKQIPALAVKCIWKEIELAEVVWPENTQAFLESIQYRKLTFEVVEVGKKELKVNILPYDDDHTSSNEEQTYQVPEVVKSEAELDLVSTESNAITKQMFNEKQLEILYEEPLNTDNAQIAVMGFQTHDDDRLCKFYDPNIGGCWKGGRCKQIHLPELKDGTCRDRCETFIDIPYQLPLPALHSMVKIEITSFISANNFYCRYKNLKLNKADVDLETLIEHMNMHTEVKNYKPLKDNPAIHQLVIAKTPSGIYYRGRVIALTDEFKYVAILLVDEGITENIQLSSLFHWRTRFQYLPFLSVQMEIANIQPLDYVSGNGAIERIASFVSDDCDIMSAFIV